jgi:hypothetical protein
VTENAFYEIQVQEQLDSLWSAWFGGLTLTHGEDHTTLLCGPVADQAALYGLLDKARDLGLTLISVRRVDSADLQAAQQPDGRTASTMSCHPASASNRP